MKFPPITPTLSHILLSGALLPLATLTQPLGWHWVWTAMVALWWFSREFAQSFRPSTMRLEWGWRESRNAGLPTLVAFGLASLFEWVVFP